jgi:hypothetical protein
MNRVVADPRREEFGGQAVEALLAMGGEHHVGALRREPPGDADADPGARPGDDHRTAVEPLFPSWSRHVK